MPVMFNTILQQEGIDPATVRLLRHQDTRSTTLHTPYELWRDSATSFDAYQSVQSIHNRSKFKLPLWASFVADPRGATLFVGLYSAKYVGLSEMDLPRPHTLGVDKAGDFDLYELQLQAALGDLIGKLYVDWGAGTRAWVQRAKDRNKPVVEIRTAFREDEFPGFSKFLKPLSEIPALPKSWIDQLSKTRGVYLLSCPKTKEQYVGSATGDDGFWGRWQSYAQTGHGGNEGLKIREASDYRVSILETAGNQLSRDDIIALEQLWKAKLQSREMGLNKN
ncbi:GIY-YIG nuclease family protein [Reyranella sp.]|uniref:GIY-YIG nuclease family protein n=1 Tax=Reyranella sp. TaxID=1929291 RepID=UPI002721CBD2|nr:GIY-YIG nuclease family protein [Reyranella sp.]MDO8973827.1 GIY-YIG nuclease family protein [Reyranella sp.]